MGIRTVMITGDNPRTAAVIAKEAGVDDFLAEATPEDKMALIRQEQQGGRLVAMTGDGTNDAPALAQADVGVAMNTGTQAAKEAGNMVDLDSDPTKLMDVVEIGKQLLITRGSLTTFSIANDVAKYFAIIPAMFAGFASVSVLNKLNIMSLASPRSAILSAVIFNTLIIVRADPTRVARGEVHPDERRAPAPPQPPDLWSRRRGRAVHRYQAHRPAGDSTGSPLIMRRQILPSILVVLVFTVIFGAAYPLVVTGIAQAFFKNKADGQLISSNGKLVGSKLIGQAFVDSNGNPIPKYFQSRPSAASGASGKTSNGYDATLSSGSNYGPSNPLLVGFIPGFNTVDLNGNSSKTNPFATKDDPYCVPMDKKTMMPVTSPSSGEQFLKKNGAYVCDSNTVPERVERVPAAQRALVQHPGAGRRGHGLGLGPRPRHLDRERTPASPTRRDSSRPPAEQGRGAHQPVHDGPRPWLPRREGRQRAGTQPGARSHDVLIKASARPPAWRG